MRQKDQHKIENKPISKTSSTINNRGAKMCNKGTKYDGQNPLRLNDHLVSNCSHAPCSYILSGIKSTAFIYVCTTFFTAYSCFPINYYVFQNSDITVVTIGMEIPYGLL